MSGGAQAGTTGGPERPGRLANTAGPVEKRFFRFAEPPNPLVLESGRTLGPIEVAYETLGELSRERDNAILVCHALSGDSHVAGFYPDNPDKLGWWEVFVGPGKAIDTTRYFVICSNVLGGCQGTTGPGSVNPETGRPYGRDFPVVTIGDMVRVQKALIDHLGIERLLAVIGGSMGGMQALDWSLRYPEAVVSCIPIASTTRLSAQALAFDVVGRHAIMSDPGWMNGYYHGRGEGPRTGLAIARMIGHITYLSDESMRKKFGRRLQELEDYPYDFVPAEFQVESYLKYKGERFLARFDANSYLYITKAMDYFDLTREYGTLEAAFARARCRYLVASFTSDWLFPSYQSKEMVAAMLAAERDVTYAEITSDWGHDAFLLPCPELDELVSSFLARTREAVRA